ncbi:MAG: aspartate/glutamate racemase family protein [Rectinemataceae bacterium]|nr:aspartate/glutamate racemase family protein [Rectinemataceae bacterium]
MSDLKIGFLHTTPSTIGMVEGFMKARLPGVAVVHIYDGNVKAANFLSPVGITPKINLLRWANFAEELQRSGCDIVVSCCSLMPRATAFAQQVVDIPCVQLDAFLLDRAVEKYSRIGVIKTTEYTVPLVKEGLETRALAAGKRVAIHFAGDNRALDLFNAGEFNKHDEIVLCDVEKLAASGVDCVLMGQIPFGLLEQKLKALHLEIPVLCAGSEAFDRLGILLADRGEHHTTTTR